MPNRGDLIAIDWLDITEDPVGNPDKASITERTTYALFWSQDDRQLVTTSTMDLESSQSGWCAYPAGCVTRVTVIKKARKKAGQRSNRVAVKARTRDGVSGGSDLARKAVPQEGSGS